MLESVLRNVIRVGVGPLMETKLPRPLGRRLLAGVSRLGAPPVFGVRDRRVRLGGVPTSVHTPKGGDDGRVILYLHGGAFVVGSASMYRHLTATLARATGARVYAPDYRLAPEHPFPAGPDDCFTVYCALLANGVSASRIALVGDSAGGGLVLGLAQRIRDAKLAAPGALVLLSPWLDLSLSGDSIRARASRDPMLSHATLSYAAEQYLRGPSPASPEVSPLFASHASLPPMLVQVGTEEVLFDDATRLETRAKQDGARVTLRVYDGLWHDFQMHAGLLARSNEAIAEIVSFLRTTLS